MKIITLKFNKPASVMLGISLFSHVRLCLADDGGLQLRLCDDGEDNASPIEQDGRSHRADLAICEAIEKALINPDRNRYLVPKRAAVDMRVVSLTHYSGPAGEQPARNNPMLSTWHFNQAAYAVSDISLISSGKIAEFVRIDADWSSRKRVGRPPEEVVEARRILADVDRIYQAAAAERSRITAAETARAA